MSEPGFNNNMNAGESKIHDILHQGTAAQVRVLSCPLSGGPLRIEYCETKTGSRHLRVTGTRSDFMMRMSGLPRKPIWVDTLGTDFITDPKDAEPPAAPEATL